MTPRMAQVNYRPLATCSHSTTKGTETTEKEGEVESMNLSPCSSCSPWLKNAMMTAANVLVHPSQFPEAVQGDLVASLRGRRVNHKFHYVSYRQAEQWLAV